jgi:hypothetical protein
LPIRPGLSAGLTEVSVIFTYLNNLVKHLAVYFFRTTHAPKDQLVGRDMTPVITPLVGIARGNKSDIYYIRGV